VRVDTRVGDDAICHRVDADGVATIAAHHPDAPITGGELALRDATGVQRYPDAVLHVQRRGIQAVHGLGAAHYPQRPLVDRDTSVSTGATQACYGQTRAQVDVPGDRVEPD